MKTLQDWLSWQESLHSSAIDLGLDRVRVLAKRMELLTIPVPVITVAGTNGKGSTCAMLTGILGAQGYKVGTYTSPHLLRYNERISINAQPLDDIPICDAFAAIDAARGDISLTYFEFGTLAAVWCFLQAGVDAIVLEVGLGGRLDACNLWDADVAVITGIGIDHVDWLGYDREAIGREKAGIMRAGHPVVCGDPDPPASIAEVAAEVGSTLLQFGRDFYLQGIPRPFLQGDVQQRNAACAVTALSCLQDQLPVSDQAVAAGLASASIPGRMQKVGNKPEIILDVAHNPEAAAQLSAWLEKNPVDGKTFVIFSILADKDVNGVVEVMMDCFDAWHVIPLAGSRAVDPHELAKRMQTVGVADPVYVQPDIQSAWNAIKSQTVEQDRVVAFGSFLVVSKVLEMLAS